MEVAEGFILKTFPYAESQFIIHAFMRNEGFTSFVTSKAPRGKRRPFTPMQQYEMEFIRNTRGDLHRLCSVFPNQNFAPLCFDVKKGNTAMLWGEILNTVLRNEQANAPLYEYICESVETLSESGEGAENLSLLFLYRLSSFIGFRPDIQNYSKGHLFNLDKGIFEAPSAVSTSDRTTGPNTAEAVYRLCSGSAEEIMHIRLDGKSRMILLDTLLCYYEIHLNTRFDRRGIDIIKETFEI